MKTRKKAGDCCECKSLCRRLESVNKNLWEFYGRAVNDELGKWRPVSSEPATPLPVLLFWRELDDDGTPSCVGCDYLGGFCAVGEWNGYQKCFEIDGVLAPYVTHWRSLPKTPEPGDEVLDDDDY